MGRKLAVLALVWGMALVLTAQAAAAQGDAGCPPERGLFGQSECAGEDGRGVSAKVQETLKEKDVPREEGAEGPPAFVAQLRKIGFTYMERHRIRVYGQELASELPPVVKQGRILIPVRAVSNALGATASWEAETGTVTICRGGVVVVLKVDDLSFTVNGETRELDLPAKVLGGRTFVPLRFVAVALGEDVEWDGEARMVFIGRGKKAPGTETCP